MIGGDELIAWGGEERGWREAGGGMLTAFSSSSSRDEGASDAGIVASDDGSAASGTRCGGLGAGRC